MSIASEDWLRAHATLWYDDRRYRLAWLALPQAGTVLLANLLFALVAQGEWGRPATGSRQRAAELEAHFRTRVRSVVRMPYDPHIASGSAISFRDLQPATREAARELAAIVVEGRRAQAAA